MEIENFFYPRELNLKISPLGMIKDTKRQEKCWKLITRIKQRSWFCINKRARDANLIDLNSVNLTARETTYLRILAGPYERPAEYLDLVYRLVSNYIHLKTNKTIKIDAKRSKQRLQPKLN